MNESNNNKYYYNKYYDNTDYQTQNSNGSYYNTGQSEMNKQPDITRYSMKWYKYVIYFQLFCSAFVNFVNAIRFITGMQYGDEAEMVYALWSELKIVDIIIAILYLAMVPVAIVIRQQLKNFKRDSYYLYLGFCASDFIITLIYYFLGFMVTGLSDIFNISTAVGSIVGYAVFIILNYTYFNK